jgi:hypothetical protein
MLRQQALGFRLRIAELVHGTAPCGLQIIDTFYYITLMQ